MSRVKRLASVLAVLFAGATILASVPVHARGAATAHASRADVDWASFELALADGAAQRGSLNLEAYGRSRRGRSLWLARVASSEDVSDRPALLVVPSGSLEERARLLETLAEAPPDGAVIFVLIAPDPDALLGDTEGREAQFELDFPVDWRPRTPALGAGTGPVPLTLTESRALVALLRAHPEVEAVLFQVEDPESSSTRGGVNGFGGNDPLAQGIEALLAGQDSETFRLMSGHALATAGGSPFAFCSRYLGQVVFGVTAARTPARALEDVEVAEPAAAIDPTASLAEASLWLAHRLPRVRFGEPSVENLVGNLWQVDLPLVNEGLLPTRRRRTPGDAAPSSYELGLEGARLVALARRQPGAEAFEVQPVASGRQPLAPLDAAERRVLRFCLEAPPGTRLDLSLYALGVLRVERAIVLE